MFRNKFKAKKTIINGIAFGSKLEASIYSLLLEKQNQGLIDNIELQKTVVLQEGKRGYDRISWKVDFCYLDKESMQIIFVEAKGFKTNDYLLKLKIWRKLKPYKLIIYEGSYKNPKITEVIEK